MFYVALYDHGNADSFMGYTTNEYIAKMYAQSDELNNIYIMQFDCDWEEFCDIMKESYVDSEYIGVYEDELRIMPSHDGESFIVASQRGLDNMLYETAFLDVFVEKFGEALMTMLYLSQSLKDKDVTKFIYYIIKTKYKQLVEEVDRGYVGESDYSDIDIVKALATQGYLGKID